MILAEYLFIVGFAMALLLVGQLKGISFRMGLLFTLSAGIILLALGVIMLGTDRGLEYEGGLNISTNYSYSGSSIVSSSDTLRYNYVSVAPTLNKAFEWITFIIGFGLFVWAAMYYNKKRG